MRHSINWSRWLRALIGIALIGEAIASETYLLVLIGAVLVIQAYLNEGCNSNCEIK